MNVAQEPYNHLKFTKFQTMFGRSRISNENYNIEKLIKTNNIQITLQFPIRIYDHYPTNKNLIINREKAHELENQTIPGASTNYFKILLPCW